MSAPNSYEFADTLGLKSIDDLDRSYLNHYLWAYIMAPMVGGFVGGVLFHIHAKCTEKKDVAEGEVEGELIETEKPLID